MKRLAVVVVLVLALIGMSDCAHAVYNWWGKDEHPLGFKIGTLMTQANYNELVDKRISELQKEVAELQGEVKSLKLSRR